LPDSFQHTAIVAGALRCSAQTNGYLYGCRINIPSYQGRLSTRPPIWMALAGTYKHRLNNARIQSVHVSLSISGKPSHQREAPPILSE